jgi:hypothetical protein
LTYRVHEEPGSTFVEVPGVGFAFRSFEIDFMLTAEEVLDNPSVEVIKLFLLVVASPAK